MKIRKLSLVIFLVMPFIFSGCAQKADSAKPIDKIQREVQTMSVQDLEAMALAYAGGIKAQRAELSRITDEMKGIPIQEIFSDKAQPIKRRLAKVQSEAEALYERYQIYAAQFKEKGGDLSNVRID